MRAAREELTGTAYSYIRFSSKKQEKGSSIERQEQLRNGWLARNPGVTLDEKLTLADLGVSAFRGRHRSDDKTALAGFLRAVEGGKVERGSILLIENLDRLTREDELAATHLFTGILLSGIRIVTIEPEQLFDRQSGQLDIMRAVLELGRGHGESLRKSQLLSKAWEGKKRAAAATRKAYGASCPQWLNLVGGVGGRYEFKPGARELIRRVNAMARAGMGARAITAKLNEDKVPHWVAGSTWDRMYVRRLITGRVVLGEYQPHRREKGKRVHDGEAIAGYFPAALTEAEFLAAQVATRERDTKGGRPTKNPDNVNIFAGLVWDGVTGSKMNALARGEGCRLMMPADYGRKGVGKGSFPVVPFERLVLRVIAEIDTDEIIGRDTAPGEVEEWEAKVKRLDAQIRNLTAATDGDDDEVPEIVAKIRAKNAERMAAEEELERAKGRAATPLSSAWKECKTLVDVLDKSKNVRETRLRLKQALARIIESITCVFASSNKLIRLAAVQMQFREGGHRRYLLVHQQAHGPSKRAAKSDARAFKEAGLPDLDVRKVEDAKVMEAALLRAAEGKVEARVKVKRGK